MEFLKVAGQLLRGEEIWCIPHGRDVRNHGGAVLNPPNLEKKKRIKKVIAELHSITLLYFSNASLPELSASQCLPVASMSFAQQRNGVPSSVGAS